MGTAAPGVMPYLTVADGRAALAFYAEVFGARPGLRLEDPAGKVAHAEMRIGEAIVMLAEPWHEMGISDPRALGGSPVTVALMVEDVDATVARAAAAGARVLRPPTDEFYGHRAARIEDPFGHAWYLASVRESLDDAEIERRWRAMFAQA
ncbi:VOC family protein [Elioraea sp. Yellowstone]|jgi:PhnB protein|uniref:VOC family protein n=1 Tax=Elioraea sp. Yellowstone TaxID=2592070 RepID=UPI0011541CC5|nr:VOC family protein [Elioraea sp. Yellowstone]TQF78485.1 VOC family protein [Elioraea sp. Yellowstone]